jgi:hypothetical protein
MLVGSLGAEVAGKFRERYHFLKSVHRQHQLNLLQQIFPESPFYLIYQGILFILLHRNLSGR